MRGGDGEAPEDVIRIWFGEESAKLHDGRRSSRDAVAMSRGLMRAADPIVVLCLRGYELSFSTIVRFPLHLFECIQFSF